MGIGDEVGNIDVDALAVEVAVAGDPPRLGQLAQRAVDSGVSQELPRVKTAMVVMRGPE